MLGEPIKRAANVDSFREVRKCLRIFTVIHCLLDEIMYSCAKDTVKLEEPLS